MDILWVVALVLIALWAVGLVTKMAGGVIHLLLVVAAIVIVVRLMSGVSAT